MVNRQCAITQLVMLPSAELTGLVWPRTHQSARLQERKHFLHRGIVVEAVDDVLDAQRPYRSPRTQIRGSLRVDRPKVV